MKRLLPVLMGFALLLLGSLANETHAQNIGKGKPFTSLCIAEKSTGFNWKKGQWVEVTFRPEKYLVVKIPLRDWDPNKYKEALLSKEPACLGKYLSYTQSKLKYYGGYRRFGCYNIRTFGSKYSIAGSRLCEESWDWSDETVLEKVRCESTYFKPDGNFTRSSIHDNLASKPENNYKDSLSLSVGSCSVIK